MGDITPVSSTSHGVTSKENEDTFAKLEANRKAGTLANSREQASDEAPKLKLSFEEKDADELSKMSKPALIKYMQEWHEHKDQIAAEMAEHAAVLAERAAIHGIPRRPRGEAIAQLLESNPRHPGRAIPYALEDESGDPRMSAGNKRRKPSPITRTDN